MVWLSIVGGVETWAAGAVSSKWTDDRIFTETPKY